MRVVYGIDYALDREGNQKELPEVWTDELYTADVVIVGKSAKLGMIKSLNKHLSTSTVESFYIFQNSLVITTRNTVYYLTVAGIH